MTRLIPILLLLIPALSWADAKPAKTKLNNKCTSYRMCDAQTVTGECVNKDPTPDQIVLNVGYVASYTYYSTQSTASSYSCDIITNKTGFDASVADSTQTDQVNTASITDEVPVYTNFVLLHRFWITCSEVADNSVTIDVDVCAR
jgi:hypothetical protein